MTILKLKEKSVIYKEINRTQILEISANLDHRNTTNPPNCRIYHIFDNKVYQKNIEH
jgi:hypothetical protein